MHTSNPNWAEVVTAIATAVSALGFLGVIGAAVFAAQQVREARQNRQAGMAADFLRRWDETDLVETRRLVAQFRTPEELRAAFQGYIASNSVEAYVLYRELDYFEQLAALEGLGAIDFELIRSLLGRRLIARWELWQPSIDAMGPDVYPLFEALVERMRAVLDTPARVPAPPPRDGAPRRPDADTRSGSDGAGGDNRVLTSTRPRPPGPCAGRRALSESGAGSRP